MNRCGRIYMADPAIGRVARCGKEAGHEDALTHGPGIPVEVTYSDGDDPKGTVLSAVAGGNPYVMAVATPADQEGNLHIDLSMGGGVEDLKTARALLERALEAVTKAGG